MPEAVSQDPLDIIAAQRAARRAELRARAVPTSSVRRKDEEQAAMTALVNKIKRHNQAWPFLDPVDLEDATDYMDVITEPIDLSAIDARLTDKHYKDLQHLKRDLDLMFKNCRKYNVSGMYVKLADSLEKFVLNEARKLEDNLDRLCNRPPPPPPPSGTGIGKKVLPL